MLYSYIHASSEYCFLTPVSVSVLNFACNRIDDPEIRKAIYFQATN